MAADDPSYEFLAMQGISVLAWDDVDMAVDFLKRFDASGAREIGGTPASRAAQSIAAAMDYARMRSLSQLSEEHRRVFVDFLKLQWALPEDEELRKELREDMLDASSEYAEELALVAVHAPRAASYIEALVPLPQHDESPLLALSEEQLRSLATKMEELRKDMGRNYLRFVPMAVAALLLLALPNVVGILLAVLTVGVAFTVDESRSYQAKVQPALRQLAIEEGIGSTQVVSWIQRMGGKAGRVGKFDIKIENDISLDLLAGLGRAARQDTEDLDDDDV
jgi:hypothetical protein